MTKVNILPLSFRMGYTNVSPAYSIASFFIGNLKFQDILTLNSNNTTKRGDSRDSSVENEGKRGTQCVSLSL